MSDKKDIRRDIRSAFSEAAPYLNIAYVFIGAILFFGYVGYRLDSYFRFESLFLLLGLFIALLGGFYNMFLVLKNLDQKEKNDSKHD